MNATLPATAACPFSRYEHGSDKPKQSIDALMVETGLRFGGDDLSEYTATSRQSLVVPQTAVNIYEASYDVLAAIHSGKGPRVEVCRKGLDQAQYLYMAQPSRSQA